MSKKNIFLLIFSIIFFLLALLFVFSTFWGTSNPQQKNHNLTNNLIDTSIRQENSSDTSNAVSEELPDINYPSLIDFKFQNKNNEEFNLSLYKNKAIALMFSNFSENYDVCVEYLSYLNSYYDNYKSNVMFLCIDKSNFVETDSNIEIYKDINGIENYTVDTLPTLIFIDKDGNIINKKTSITLDSLEANLDLIIGNF